MAVAVTRVENLWISRCTRTQREWLGCAAPTALAVYLQLSFEGMW